MNKIIILGCGYIGTNLANYIVNHFQETVYVVGIYNEYVNLLNSKVKFIEKYIEQICDDDKVLFENSIVIDAVGNTNATFDSKSSSTLFLQNCSNKVELIKKLSDFEIKKYIFLSSGGTVYSDSSEPHIENENVNPTNIYALEKVIIENYLKIKGLEDKEFNFLILRLSNPYGGIVSPYKKQGIIDVIINKINNNEVFELFGEMDNIRDYIYIDNVSEYIYRLSNSTVKNEIFNVGSGKGTSIREVIDIIEKIYKKKLNLEVKSVNTINICSNVLNVNKLESVIVLEKKYSLLDGIVKDYGDKKGRI